MYVCVCVYLSPRCHNQNLWRTGPKAHKPQPAASIYTFKDRFKRREHSRFITGAPFHRGGTATCSSTEKTFARSTRKEEVSQIVSNKRSAPTSRYMWGSHGNKQASLSAVFAELMVNTLSLFFHVLVDWISQWAGMTKESILILTLRKYGWRREGSQSQGSSRYIVIISRYNDTERILALTIKKRKEDNVISERQLCKIMQKPVF